jgi:hypothetical protein
MYYGTADTRMIVHLHDINNMVELFTALGEIDFAIRTKESISKVEFLNQLPEEVDTKDKCLIRQLDNIEITNGSLKFKDE